MKKFLAVALIFSLTVSALSGCENRNQAGGQTSGTSAYKDTVNIGMSTSCPSMDPQSNTDQSSKILYKVMHMTLVAQDENLKPTPGLAESWKQTGPTTLCLSSSQRRQIS